MTPVHEGTDRIEVVTRYRPRDMDARLFSTVDQVPVGLVVPGVEHHTVVQLEVRRLDRKLSAFQVFGGSHDIANALAYTGGDHARVLQLSEADRDVNIFRNQIEEEIRDEEVDADPWLSFQESREEVQEGLLTQNDRNGHPQHTFGRLLPQGQNSLSLFQEGQRLPALIEVLTSLRSQGHPSRCAPQERHAELRLQHRQPPAHRRDRHTQRAGRPADAL